MLYEAPDLRQHVLNAASVETSRGFRLSKEKQSLKIDGAVALSFACVAAGQVGRPLSPEEVRNFREPEVDTRFRSVRPLVSFHSAIIDHRRHIIIKLAADLPLAGNFLVDQALGETH